MTYVLGKPKAIEVCGITFHVQVPWGIYTDWDYRARQLWQEAANIDPDEDPAVSADKQMEIQDKNRRLNEEALAFIVGWEGVVDDSGNEVPFSREALEQLDVAVVQQLLSHLTDIGQQIMSEVEEGNRD